MRFESEVGHFPVHAERGSRASFRKVDVAIKRSVESEPGNVWATSVRCLGADGGNSSGGSDMEIEDVQGRKIPVKGGGRCIYCGSDGGADGLRDEHVVPYSLGGTTELLQASCADCEAVTSYLDGYLANAIYRFLRVHSGVKSRSGHPKLLPAHVIQAGDKKVLDLAPPDHPYFLHMPVWNAPGIMRGLQPSANFGDARAHVYWWIPPTIRQTLGLGHGDVAEIQDTTPMPNLHTFARGIAKIAYCNAVLKFGLDGFRPFATPELILGRYPNIPYFVGSDRADPPPPERPGVLHVMHFTTVEVGRLKYFTVRFRLFAHSGTAENGMPYYEVVVGAEGKPKAGSRRSSPKLPRVIIL